MKHLFKRFAVLVLLFSFVSLSAMPAKAEINIAVVDIEKILLESKASKSVQEQVDKNRSGFLAEVKKEEDKLRADKKAIEDKRADFSQEELMKKAQGFEKERIEARNKIEGKKTKLDKAYSEAMRTLTKTIYDVCQEIADEKKIDLVITRQNIIVGSMSLDITKEVLERMNKKLPDLKL